MTMKEQWEKIKENWMLIAALVLLVLFMSGGTNLLGGIAGTAKYASRDVMAGESAGYYGRGYDDGFAPNVEERLLVKTASMSTKVERGSFDAELARLKSIVSYAGGLVLTENVNAYGEGVDRYTRGNLQLKIPISHYDEAVTQLKGVGEVQSFNENARDVTGSALSLEEQLAAEEARVENYRAIMNEARTVEEKFETADRVFDQERVVTQLRQQAEKTDQKVEYATVSVSITEERSGYANMGFTTFTQLVKNLVESTSTLLTLLFVVLPWLVVLLIARITWKLTQRKK